MKNIHLIATDKPSRLLVRNDKPFVSMLKEHSPFSTNKTHTNQHIYITSDEEIKEGDWFIHKTYAVLSLHKCIGRSAKQNVIGNDYIEYMLGYCKKVILTTDQDLIKDGVQAIDDEFLEWFVKNPSCVRVEVANDLKYFNVDELRERHLKGLPHLYSESIGYKIIIPKEEPKQETLEEAAENESEYLADYEDKEMYQKGFIAGAKWEKENSNVNALHFEIDALKRLVKVLEHQQERTYSEEQVIELLEYTRENFYDTGTKWHEEPYKDLTSKELLEQFKKK
jgi:hypothetical protein